MANKSKKIAARQAQLRARSKKGKSHGPSGIPVAATQKPKENSSKPVDINAAGQEPIEQITPQASTAVAEPIKRRSRVRGIQVKPIETYFVQEIRRIGIISAGIFATLVALIFVMP
ncbi:hypothetical protein FIL93_00555 [SAR202 cluster bacterium AD-493-K16_JPT_193m]|nr:hypothetical protein [SAR202 cluster bacterium AD-493-K16_JPT_193m]